jgi:Family of unknown function (DUF6228)
LAFTSPRHPYDDDMVEYLVTVETAGLSVESPVLSLAGGDGLPAFLESVASNFRGWTGAKPGGASRTSYGSKPLGPTEGTSRFSSGSSLVFTRLGKSPPRSPSRPVPRCRRWPPSWRAPYGISSRSLVHGDVGSGYRLECRRSPVRLTMRGSRQMRRPVALFACSFAGSSRC